MVLQLVIAHPSGKVKDAHIGQPVAEKAHDESPPPTIDGAGRDLDGRPGNDHTDHLQDRQHKGAKHSLPVSGLLQVGSDLLLVSVPQQGQKPRQHGTEGMPDQKDGHKPYGDL